MSNITDNNTDNNTDTNTEIQIESLSLSNINNNCYIIFNHDHYKYMEDYILSFYKKLNAKILLFNNVNEIQNINKTDIYIFIQTIPHELLNQMVDNTNIYLLNTEQMGREHYNNIMNTFPKNIKRFDYSKANLKYYDKEVYAKFLSYQINYDEIYNLPKTNDVCIMTGGSNYRQNITNQLQDKNIHTDIIYGWKKERDEKLFTYKILLNISIREECKIFEALRCDRCIFNRMIVISNEKEDMETYHLKDHMIFVNYHKMVDKIIDVINNYDMYYKQLGLDTLDLNTLKIEPVEL